MINPNPYPYASKSYNRRSLTGLYPNNEITMNGLPLLTIAEVAEQLSISTKTVYRWIAEKKITYVRLPGGDIRFRQSEIETWLKEKTIKSQRRIA